jgi:hypothetical protein
MKSRRAIRTYSKWGSVKCRCNFNETAPRKKGQAFVHLKYSYSNKCKIASHGEQHKRVTSALIEQHAKYLVILKITAISKLVRLFLDFATKEEH